MPVGTYKPLMLTPINFSLTEGTVIPAPPDSPPESHPPTPGAGPLSSHPMPHSPDFSQHRESLQCAESEDSSVDERLDRIQTNDAASSILSPTSPSSRHASPPRRPSSSRKFWGMRSLSSSDGPKSERPTSPATIHSQAPSLSGKKSGGWFGKMKTFSSSHNGTPEEKEKPRPSTNGHANPRPIPVTPAPQPTPITQPKKKDPPPPALPELRSFGVSEDTFSLGADDMFKNIK